MDNTINSIIVEDEEKVKKREYARKWYQEHKAVNKEPISYNINYQREYHKKYYKKNRDKIIEYQKDYNKKSKTDTNTIVPS